MTAVVASVSRRRALLVCTILVSLWSAGSTCAQTAPAGALSGELRSHVAAERFQMVTSLRGLPLGVREGLQTLFDSTGLDIAEPGAPFRGTDASENSTLPRRRMIAAGCSMDHCLVYYERGGGTHTWLVALFHWTASATRFEWGAAAPANIKSIEDVHTAVVSGAIKGPNKVW